MIIAVHSGATRETIASKLGGSEYSYYFVLEAFRPVLEKLGHVVDIVDPAHEVDTIHALAARYGEACVFLSFTPPHQTETGLRCPTVPLFAWEFDTIPSEAWDAEWRNDWRAVLAAVGRAVTHSGFAAAVTREAMGRDYDIRCIPAPVWDRFAALRAQRRRPSPHVDMRITVTGRVIDTRDTDLSPFLSTVRRARGQQPLPGSAADRDRPAQVEISGILYTSVFNPSDGRKNWYDMISAFVWAFRDEPEATLVLKLTNANAEDGMCAILEDLAKLRPFRCRVVLIDGFLAEAEYMALVAASAFTVNASHGEGQCLPLMEAMSAGIPAISPAHTSMADYLDETDALLVGSSREAHFWPHDPRRAIRTRRHRIDWGSLVEAFRRAQRLATASDRREYDAMSASAHARLRAHCSEAVVGERLGALLADAAGSAGVRVPRPSPPPRAARFEAAD